MFGGGRGLESRGSQKRGRQTFHGTDFSGHERVTSVRQRSAPKSLVALYQQGHKHKDIKHLLLLLPPLQRKEGDKNVLLQGNDKASKEDEERNI